MNIKIDTHTHISISICAYANIQISYRFLLSNWSIFEWCIWWRDDFSVDGGALRMYDHKFVKSKTKARERVRAGETDIYFSCYVHFCIYQLNYSPINLFLHLCTNKFEHKNRHTYSYNMMISLLNYVCGLKKIMIIPYQKNAI